jgi:hypothetical protein
MLHCRSKLGVIPLLLLCLALCAHSQTTGKIAGPLVASSNPHYFKDANGAALILAGSQTWNTLQDWGSDGAAQALDFDAFVKFLSAHGQNFTLLWRVEMPKFCSLPSTSGASPDFTVSPQPWQRKGPGKATDGGLKFDLTQFDQGYFDRLRARTQALNNAGIYAGIYLFTGEFINLFRCASDGYPFTGANNMNGIDDGYTSGPKGMASMTMTAPKAVTRFQDAYVEKVIDTLNDLPNVLWVVSEEAPNNTQWFNNYQIAHIRKYESGKQHQHPIGWAAPLPSVAATDPILYNSNADWVAPNSTISPTTSCGSGAPACKVNINDSDHSYYGAAWKDTPQQNRNYVWKNFANGSQVLFMDPYLLYYPRQNRNLCISPTRGICSSPDPRWNNFRDNLGYTLKYSRKLNLVNVTPHPALCSTTYCLAQTPSVGAEYLVYAPSGGSFTVDLSAMPKSRKLAVQWFNPATGATIVQRPIPSGSSAQPFTPPFSGDAVLYLVDTAGHAT